MILDDVLAAIKHFEGQQRRYMGEHNGRACVHLGAALVALKDKALVLNVAAEPVRHGAWVGKHKSTCSECGDVNLRAYVGPTPLYCQVCGARMDLDPAMAEKEDSR